MTTNKILSILFALLLLVGCDYNDKYFEGYDDNVEPTDIKSLDYTLTDEDYKAIAGNSANMAIAKEKGDSVALSKLSTNKYFAEPIDADIYAPAFIASKWYTADDGSAVKLTYNKLLDTPEYLAPLAAAETYVVSNSDYASVWGEVEAEYFTPLKPLNRSASKLLSTAYPDAADGDIKIIQYNYSITEPSTGGGAVEYKELNEGFDYITEGDKNKKVELEGWKNIAEVGGKYWVNNYFNGGYVQCTAYGSSEDIVSWLISPKVNLSGTTAPKLAFDVCLGYPNGAEMKVLVSNDFNGSDVSTATWMDITAHFAFDTPKTGYGKMSPAGIYDMSGYKDSPVYIAFKYIGNASKTTTFQIDNIQLGDNVNVVATNFLKEDFEGDYVYINKSVEGTISWELKSFNNNKYLQTRAFQTTGPQDVYLVSPAIEIPALSVGVPELLFDVCVGSWNANCLSVLISTDYTDNVETATWIDITNQFAIPEIPTSGYGVMGAAGAAALNAYAGQTIYVAFRYEGNADESRSTTYQLDNIRIATFVRQSTFATMASASTRAVGGINELAMVYTFNGSIWAPYENATIVAPADYEEMGFETFSSSNQPANYIPQFLAKTYPYAQEGKVIGVVYTYGSTQESAEYIHSNGLWAKNAITEVATDQFVRSGGKWNFDPSITITLVPVRNGPMAGYFQAIVDYVMSIHGTEYNQLGTNGKPYDNAEFYYGASSYQGNISFRISDWRTGNQAGKDGAYDGEYSDDKKLTELMYERLKEAFIPALKKYHGDMAPIEGIDVLCTIQFGIYTGSSITACTHQMVYKVVGQGEFEYVEDSLIELK